MNTKFINLATLLVTALEVKKPLLGGENFITLKESQLQAIEDALTKNDVSAIEKDLASLKEEKNQWLVEAQKIKEETEKAMLLNKLSVSNSVAENIALLGEKCKEYGEKTLVHSLPLNNGKETEKGEFEGIVNMNDKHNII
jgi:hypothetical protein|nr:MAG TPA: hypothetical protein [Bacteriophage sp.]